MIYKVFSVYDSKIGSYLSPFVVRSKGEAIRAITNELENSNSNLSKHPGDFTLFEIGDYDDEHGTLVPIAPASVGVLVEFVQDA